jgi:hypothetical protein
MRFKAAADMGADLGPGAHTASRSAVWDFSPHGSLAETEPAHDERPEQLSGRAHDVQVRAFCGLVGHGRGG